MRVLLHLTIAATKLRWRSRCEAPSIGFRLHKWSWRTGDTMKFFNGLLFGIIVGVAAFWFLQDKARQHPEAEQRFKDSADKAGAAASEAAHHLSDALKAKFETLDLRSDQITAEMAKDGKIVRRKAQDVTSTLEIKPK